MLRAGNQHTAVRSLGLAVFGHDPSRRRACSAGKRNGEFQDERRSGFFGRLSGFGGFIPVATAGMLSFSDENKIRRRSFSVSSVPVFGVPVASRQRGRLQRVEVQHDGLVPREPRSAGREGKGNHRRVQRERRPVDGAYRVSHVRGASEKSRRDLEKSVLRGARRRGHDPERHRERVAANSGQSVQDRRERHQAFSERAFGAGRSSERGDVLLRRQVVDRLRDGRGRRAAL